MTNAVQFFILTSLKIDMSALRTSHKYDWDAAFLLYMGKMSLDKIGEMLNIPVSMVQEKARKFSWYHRRNTAIQGSRYAINEDLKKKIEDYKVKHLNFMIDQGEEVQEVIGKIDLEELPGMVGTKLELLEKHHGIQSKVLKLDEPDKTDPNTMGFHVLIALQKRNGNALVNNTNSGELVELESQNNESAEIDALRRSLPLDDKNATEPILRQLNGICVHSEEQKTTNSGNNGHSGEEKEQEQSINELADELGVSKGTGLPPINWGD